MRKEQLEREHVDRERGFVERLNESHETAMKRLADSHRERIALLDRQFLQQKQQLMRAREVSRGLSNSVPDPCSLNLDPDPAKNLCPDPDSSTFLTPSENYSSEFIFIRFSH